MARDKLRDDKYYEDYIISQDKRIEKFQSTANSQQDREKKNRLIRVIANMQKDLFTAKYSLGVDIEELRRSFETYLSNMKLIHISEYGELIDIIGICVLLDIDCSELIAVCDERLTKDGFVELLLKKTSINNGSLFFEEYYLPFYLYLKGEKNLEDLVEYMNSSWYQNSSEFAWYDSDKSKEDVYVGYWCWIAAAVMKLRGDTRKQDIKFVPTDLI